MMRSKVTKIIGCVVTLMLIAGLLISLTNLTERKSSDRKYADFFRDQDFDVLFMGTSHVINGIFPMELWKDYGMTSYNFGGHGNELGTSYWVLENIWDYMTPKVVVIDCYYLSSDVKSNKAFDQMHLSLDTFPLSWTKIRGIWDLLDDPAMDELIKEGKINDSSDSRTRIGLLWDYSVYHSRWNELTKNDFVLNKNREKGAESRIAVVPGGLKKIDPDQKSTPGTTGESYLRKMIEECQGRGIGVVLTYLPFPASEDQQMEANRAYDIAEEYGVPYLNFLDMDGIVNYQTDMYDSNSHVNPSGARKISTYLGSFLQEHFDIPDKRNDAEYEYWDVDYTDYESLKNSNMVKQKDIMKYLMLLAGDDVETVMYVQNKDIYRNGPVRQMMINLGAPDDLLDSETDFILMKNKKYEAVLLNGFSEDGAEVETLFGMAALSRGAGGEGARGKISLTVEGWKSIDIPDETELGLRIDVYRHDKLIDRVRFDYVVNPVNNEIVMISFVHDKV